MSPRLFLRLLRDRPCLADTPESSKLRLLAKLATSLKSASEEMIDSLSSLEYEGPVWSWPTDATGLKRWVWMPKLTPSFDILLTVGFFGKSNRSWTLSLLDVLSSSPCCESEFRRLVSSSIAPNEANPCDRETSEASFLRCCNSFHHSSSLSRLSTAYVVS